MLAIALDSFSLLASVYQSARSATVHCQILSALDSAIDTIRRHRRRTWH
ncbi:MAG: hypothetical protein ACFB4J_05445 [Elainellaceae cyanobacterium]